MKIHDSGVIAERIKENSQTSIACNEWIKKFGHKPICFYQYDGKYETKIVYILWSFVKVQTSYLFLYKEPFYKEPICVQNNLRNLY